jgi:hypothetical protein
MRVIYDIKPKSHEEYCDVIDAISEWLDRNNIEHKKSEILDESGQDKISQNKPDIKKFNNNNGIH